MKKRRIQKSLALLIIVVFLFLSSIPNGCSDIFSVQKNIGEKASARQQIKENTTDMMIEIPTDDAKISLSDPNTHYGYLPDMAVRNRFGFLVDNGEFNSLVRFHINSIAQSSVYVTDATLHLYYSDFDGIIPAGRYLNLHKITSEWNEDDVTWTTRPSYSNQITDTAQVPNIPGEWMTWDVTNDVKDFVYTQEANYGWQVMDEEYWGTFLIPETVFYSKEYGDFTPYLTINTLRLEPTFLVGTISNLDTEYNFLTFNASNMYWVRLFPFDVSPYYSDEPVIISNQYLGIVTDNVICGLFQAYV